MPTPVVTGRLKFSLEAFYTIAENSSSGPIRAALEGFEDVRFDNGFGFGQIDRAFYQRYSMAAAGTQDIDLAGTLLDYFNNTVTFGKIVALAIRSRGTVVGASATWKPKGGGTGYLGVLADATDIMALEAAGLGPFWYAPFGKAVVAGTDVLTITNGSVAQDVEVMILGRSQ